MLKSQFFYMQVEKIASVTITRFEKNIFTIKKTANVYQKTIVFDAMRVKT